MAVILKDFIDNPHIINIELGAGCGNFGQKYHSECFLTDRSSPNELKQKCSNCFVTIFYCDAHNIPCGDNRFNTLLMCNPFGYGFKDSEDGLVLLNELARVLRDKGKVIILGTSSNTNAQPKRIERRIREFNRLQNLVQFTILAQKIDSQQEYSGHAFFNTDGITPTTPNNRITLICNK